MALASIRNERDLIVFNGVAAQTTASTFIASATAGQGQVLTDMGTAPAGKTKFMFAYKHLDGRYRVSDIVNPDKIAYYKLVTPVTEVLPKADITIATATAGDLYEIMVRIYNDGALSLENSVSLNGSYQAVTGDTVTTIAAGLVLSLNQALTRMGQTYFTVSNAAGVITLQSTKLPFVVGKKDGRALNFDLKATQVNPLTLAITSLTVAYTAYTPDPTSVQYLRDLEWLTRGAFADDYRGLAYPDNFDFASDVVIGTTYHLLEIGFYDGDRNDHGVQKSPRHITLAVPAANIAAVKALVDKCIAAIDLSTAATNGQALKWNSTSNTFVPTT